MFLSDLLLYVSRPGQHTVWPLSFRSPVTEQYSEASEDLQIPPQIQRGVWNCFLHLALRVFTLSLGSGQHVLKPHGFCEAPCCGAGVKRSVRSNIYVLAHEHGDTSLEHACLMSTCSFLALTWMSSCSTCVPPPTRCYSAWDLFKGNLGGGGLLASTLNRERLRQRSLKNSVTDIISFIGAFLFILVLFLFVLLKAAGSESCLWTLKKRFPFPLAYLERLILSNESSGPLQK